MKTHKSCLVGSEMVDWLIHLSPVVFSRSLAVGMWQSLLEENTITHGNTFLLIKQTNLIFVGDRTARK